MIYVVFWILCGIAGAALMSRHSKAGIGCVLGMLLGPIGIIIAWVMRSDADAAVAISSSHAPGTDPEGSQKCPFCAETIKAEAKVCRYCGRDLPATA